ncbi:hypothetical protein ACL6C3_19090 [Capilliphycus salinus ALCB114379]|uniref:Npun_F0296 family exosortase-dependent surface protein n=1 Tax=Capilliphycus salinus TaxID=2768948 RepID=UPI0039A50049
MKTTQKAVAFAALTALSTFGVANTAHAGVMFRMNQGVAYGENGNMGIATPVENTATIDFNDLIPNVQGSKSSTNFSNDFASYTFENGKKSSVIADQWVPENIDRTVNKTNPYLAVFSGDRVTIDLKSTANYFGLNWGSVSQNNRIEFFKGDTLISAFQSAGNNVNQPVEGQAELNAAWKDVKGSHSATNFWNEADAYLEFWAEDVNSLFDRIVLTQLSSTGGGFETDNHSFLLSNKGFDPNNNKSVPEPGMVVGLLAIGGLIAQKKAKKS